MKIPPVGDGGEPVSQKNIFHETLFGGIALSDQFRVGPVDFLVLLVKGAGILAVQIPDLPVVAGDSQIFEEAPCQVKNLSVLHDGKWAAVGQIVCDRKTEGTKAVKQGVAVGGREKLGTERAQNHRKAICQGKDKMDAQRVGEMDDLAGV